MITLINPNLVVQRSDPFTTGIVYMPIGLAYFAAALKREGLPLEVVDAFGQAPGHSFREGNFLFRGLTPQEIVSRISPEVKVIVLYAIHISSHRILLILLDHLKKAFPDIPVIVMENTQAVTAYALRFVAEDFFKHGAACLLTSEAEVDGVQLIRSILGGHFSKEVPLDRKFIDNLDALAFPAWELFPLQNYWKLRYAHGPVESKKYLPMLTSRGCPYPCRFCVIPETNQKRWRARSAKNVVDEMEFFFEKFGVQEFHWEDVNPTIQDKRIRQICEEIVSRQLPVIWKMVAGTKVESIKNEETIALMAKAGCRYISISPESGSPRVMERIQKPFDRDHALRLIGAMQRHRIRSQACFVLGFPGETSEDRMLTQKMVKDLTCAGVDEIAQFIITPMPGSAIFKDFSGFEDYSQLTFSPAWRKDYPELNRFRFRLYLKFLFWKVRFYPWGVLRQALNFLRRHFETKMEMTPYRVLKTWNKIHPFVWPFPASMKR